jgi:hypothetical protein
VHLYINFQSISSSSFPNVEELVCSVAAAAAAGLSPLLGNIKVLLLSILVLIA